MQMPTPGTQNRPWDRYWCRAWPAALVAAAAAATVSAAAGWDIATSSANQPTTNAIVIPTLLAGDVRTGRWCPGAAILWGIIRVDDARPDPTA